MKKFVSFLFLFLASIVSIYSADVQAQVDIYSEYTLFTYTFTFSDDESFRSFSFEKPEGSKVDFLNKQNSNESVKYSVAGDYFIVEPSSIRNSTFVMRFASEDVSKQIYDKKAFVVYSNFNFVVDKLNFNVKLVEEIGEINEFYPRDYKVLGDNSYSWEIFDLNKEELFRLEFENVLTKEEIEINKTKNNSLIIIISGAVLLSILVLLILIFVFSEKFSIFGFKKDLKKNHKIEDKKVEKKFGVKIKTSELEDKDLEKENIDISTISHETDLNEKISTDDIEILKGETEPIDPDLEINEDEYREVMARFLTDNEKLVVSCIRENDGISQFDILNFLPKLTKSNLSKIITKLDNKKILKRIRVGKINKIYLGSKFDLPKSDSDENK